MATLKVEIPQNSLNVLGTATVNAPLEKVFAAYVHKDLFIKWFCRGNEVKSKQFVGESGGVWDITEKSSDGSEWGFYGVFHEVEKNERIIWTFEFLGIPERGHTSLERMDFRAIDDNTTEIKSTSVFLTQADRDSMIDSGMEAGWRDSVEALEQMLQNQ